MKSFSSGCSVVIVIGLAISTALGQATKPSPGQAIFKSKCSLCHGADGSGKTTLGQQMKASDLRSTDVQKQSDAQLKDVVTQGKNSMPGFESQLSGNELAEVLSYVRQFGRKTKALSTPAQK